MGLTAVDRGRGEVFYIINVLVVASSIYIKHRSRELPALLSFVFVDLRSFS